MLPDRVGQMVLLDWLKTIMSPDSWVAGGKVMLCKIYLLKTKLTDGLEGAVTTSYILRDFPGKHAGVANNVGEHHESC